MQSVQETRSANRLHWLVAGVGLGLCLSWVWPHEPAQAVTADRDEKFAMITVPVKDISFAGVKDQLDGVFVLDFLTGQLKGVVINSQSGKFTHAYMRNVALDFQIDPNATARYTIGTGLARLPTAGRVQMAAGVIYVGEMSSGKVAAYGFPYADGGATPGAVPLMPLDVFAFRDVVQ